MWAAIAALIDLLIATIVLLAASKSHPGPESQDVAAQKLLIPTAMSILRGLRSKKEHA